MVSLAPVSVIRSNAHRTRRVRGSRTPDTSIDTRVIIQKSEEATASSASMLATPMLRTWIKREMFCTLSSAVRLGGVGEEGRGEERSVASTSAVTVKVCDALLLHRSLCEEVTSVSRCPRPY